MVFGFIFTELKKISEYILNIFLKNKLASSELFGASC